MSLAGSSGFVLMLSLKCPPVSILPTVVRVATYGRLCAVPDRFDITFTTDRDMTTGKAEEHVGCPASKWISKDAD